VGFELRLTLRPGFSTIRIEVKRGGRWGPLCRIKAGVALAADAADAYSNYMEAEARRLPPIAALAVREADKTPPAPLISVLMPVINARPTTLRAAIACLQAQQWPYWELIAVTDSAIEEVASNAAGSDARIRILNSSQEGAAHALNHALAFARGEWVALLNQDDVLSPYALALVARAIRGSADVDLIYTDEDKIDANGRRHEPLFKPAWSPLWSRGVMYLRRLLVMRRRVVQAVGGCDPRYDGIHDFELALRVSERARKVVHVAEVLYHHRASATARDRTGSALRPLDQLQAMAVQESLDRLGMAARAEAGPRERVRLVPSMRRPHPHVSALVRIGAAGAEDVSRCLAGLFSGPGYSAMEVIVGYDEEASPEALQVLQRYAVRRVAQRGKCAPARLYNLMAAEAGGELFLLRGGDTEVVAEGWLDHLLLHATAPDVGAVGPLVARPDGTVQYAGFVLGAQGAVGTVMRGLAADADGYFGSLFCAREVSALSGACFLVRADLYRQVGGMNEYFRQQYEDVDFCLRLRALGLRNILVPGSWVVQAGSGEQRSDFDYTDRVLLLDRWEAQMRSGDPYHNPHFDGDVYYRIGAAA
jgi:GT2 family glycosyltransferase